MINLTKKEKEALEKFIKIKEASGSHSPSINELKDAFPEIDIKVDACYLSNPYASHLFLKYLKELSKEELIKLIEHYPSQNRKLAEYISMYINVDPKNIIVGNGASEIISFLMYHYLEGKTLLPIPTFSPYYEYASSKNKIMFFKLKEENDFKYPLDEIEEIIYKKEIDNIVLINPNNPNGFYIELDLLIPFIDRIYNYVSYIVIDESFIHFVDENTIPYTYNLLSLFPKKLIIVKSMSKDFGIAGLRIGYAVCDETIINTMLHSGFLWNISGFGEFFLRLLAFNKTFRFEYEKIRKEYVKNTKDFINSLRKIIKIYPSKANFVLAKTPIDSDLFTFLLLYRYGIYD